jgi:hypothetical protein
MQDQDIERAQWLTILEAASANPPNAMNAEWEWLIGELGLPLDYWLAVRAAIRQGRWREAKNPRAYIKTVANREARKMGLMDTADSKLVLIGSKTSTNGSYVSSKEILGYLSHTFGTSEATKRGDGVWRRGDGREDDYDRPEWVDEFESAWDYILSKLPNDLKLENEPSAETKADYETINAQSDEDYRHMRTPVKPNWKAWGERAGFDEWEQLALECRMSHKSREKALAEQPDEPSRKALQAAWKRFDRTGMERLQKALKINSAKNVPE